MIKINGNMILSQRMTGRESLSIGCGREGVKKENAAIDEWLKDIANHTSSKQNTDARSCG